MKNPVFYSYHMAQSKDSKGQAVDYQPRENMTPGEKLQEQWSRCLFFSPYFLLSLS